MLEEKDVVGGGWWGRESRMWLMWHMCLCTLAQQGLGETGNNSFVFHVPINCETNSVTHLFFFLIVYMIFSSYMLKTSQTEQMSHISIFAECGKEVCIVIANRHSRVSQT